MLHKQFWHTVDLNKAIDVQFNLEYDDAKVIVTTLQINANFDLNFPTSPELKYHHNRWKFYDEYEEKIGDEYLQRFRYYDNELIQSIISQILKIKEQETSKFIN